MKQSGSKTTAGDYIRKNSGEKKRKTNVPVKVIIVTDDPEGTKDVIARAMAKAYYKMIYPDPYK